MANTPPPKLREALESLATPEARARIQLDINYLLEHPDEIVPYFTSKDADGVCVWGGLVTGEGGMGEGRGGIQGAKEWGAGRGQ